MFRDLLATCTCMIAILVGVLQLPTPTAACRSRDPKLSVKCTGSKLDVRLCRTSEYAIFKLGYSCTLNGTIVASNESENEFTSPQIDPGSNCTVSGQYTKHDFNVKDVESVSCFISNIDLDEAPANTETNRIRRVVLISENVSLLCGTNLTGYPQPTVRWLLNSEVVHSGNRYTYSDGPDVVQLNISNVSLNDNGEWTCQISNTHEEDKKEIQTHLLVYSKPSNPTNLSETHTATEVNITWQPPDHLGYPEFSYYKISLTSNDSSVNDSDYHTNSSYYFFSGLTPATIYYFIVTAVIGTSTISTDGIPSSTLMIVLDPPPVAVDTSTISPSVTSSHKPSSDASSLPSSATNSSSVSTTIISVTSVIASIVVLAIFLSVTLLLWLGYQKNKQSLYKETFNDFDFEFNEEYIEIQLKEDYRCSMVTVFEISGPEEQTSTDDEIVATDLPPEIDDIQNETSCNKNYTKTAASGCSNISSASAMVLDGYVANDPSSTSDKGECTLIDQSSEMECHSPPNTAIDTKEETVVSYNCPVGYVQSTSVAVDDSMRKDICYTTRGSSHELGMEPFTAPESAYRYLPEVNCAANQQNNWSDNYIRESSLDIDSQEWNDLQEQSEMVHLGFSNTPASTSTFSLVNDLTGDQQQMSSHYVCNADYVHNGSATLQTGTSSNVLQQQPTPDFSDLASDDSVSTTTMADNIACNQPKPSNWSSDYIHINIGDSMQRDNDTLEEQFTLDLSDSTSFNSQTSPTIPSVATGSWSGEAFDSMQMDAKNDMLQEHLALGMSDLESFNSQDCVPMALPPVSAGEVFSVSGNVSSGYVQY